MKYPVDSEVLFLAASQGLAPSVIADLAHQSKSKDENTRYLTSQRLGFWKGFRKNGQGIRWHGLVPANTGKDLDNGAVVASLVGLGLFVLAKSFPVPIDGPDHYKASADSTLAIGQVLIYGGLIARLGVAKAALYTAERLEAIAKAGRKAKNKYLESKIPGNATQKRTAISIAQAQVDGLCELN